MLLLSDLAARAKAVVRTNLRRAGYDVRRVVIDDDLGFLRPLGIRTVLDIGANRGQFAARARRLLPAATIHSFEPVPGTYAHLANAASSQSRWFVHQLAVGDAEREIEMEVNEFSPSSSLLPLAAAHKSAYPFAAQTTKAHVKMMTLDSWARTTSLERPLMIKMDVQGYEEAVIRGATDTLALTTAVVTEVSFVTMYERQALFDDVYMRLRELGFRCVGVSDVSYHPKDGTPLFADAVFLRKSE